MWHSPMQDTGKCFVNNDKFVAADLIDKENWVYVSRRSDAMGCIEPALVCETRHMECVALVCATVSAAAAP